MPISLRPAASLLGRPKWISAAGGAWLAIMSFLADQLALTPRLLLCVPGAALAVYGFAAASRAEAAQNKRKALEQRDRRLHIGAFEQEVVELDFTDTLDSLIQRLVRGGSWRLGLYELGDEGWVRRVRRATDPRYEVGGRPVLPIEGSVMVRALNGGLRSKDPVIEVTGAFTDASLDPEAWVDEQGEWNVAPEDARAMRYRCRKLGMAGIRLEGSGGRVFAVVLEVSDPDSIDRASFEGVFTRDVLTLLSKMCSAQLVIREARSIVQELDN